MKAEVNAGGNESILEETPKGRGERESEGTPEGIEITPEVMPKGTPGGREERNKEAMEIGKGVTREQRNEKTGKPENGERMKKRRMKGWIN